MNAPAPGPPHRGGEGRSRRGIPRSRAYWELKAEQMMNRIFDPEEPIDLAYETRPAEAPASDPARTDPDSAAKGAAAAGSPTSALPGVSASGSSRRDQGPREPSPPAAERPSRSGTPSAPSRPRSSSRRPATARPESVRNQGRGLEERGLLIAALVGVSIVSVAGSLLYFGYWNRLQQSLTQERNLLLVERLRNLGPANPAPVLAPSAAPAAALPAPATSLSPSPAPTADGEGLPPPPPEEPWIEQLSTLPRPAPQPARVLTVPVSPPLAAASTPAQPGGSPAAAPVRSQGPLPQLVGVVAGVGRIPSAIFLVGGNSLSVSAGEVIGSSGWRLRSAGGETALIERNGEVRQISIVSGNGF